MNKILQIAISGFLALTGVANLNAQCEASVGTFEAPTITEFCPGTDDLADLFPNFTTDPNSDFDFGWVITINTSDTIDQWDENIEYITEPDGIIDFAFLPGTNEYCFSSMSYSREELNIITSNPTVQSLLPSGCLAGGESLQETIACIKENFPLSTIEGAVDSILAQVIPLVVPEFIAPNNPPCFVVLPTGMEYCVTILGPNDNCIVGINEFYANDAFATSNFPNPFKNVTTVKFYAETPGTVNFKVYDLLGNLIIDESKTANQGNNDFDFDATDFNNGVYFYTVGNDEAASPSRMVINK